MGTHASRRDVQRLGSPHLSSVLSTLQVCLCPGWNLLGGRNQGLGQANPCCPQRASCFQVPGGRGARTGQGALGSDRLAWGTFSPPFLLPTPSLPFIPGPGPLSLQVSKANGRPGQVTPGEAGWGPTSREKSAIHFPTCRMAVVIN